MRAVCQGPRGAGCRWPAAWGLSLWLLAWGVGRAGPVTAAFPEEKTFFVRAWRVEDGTPANTVVGVARRPDGYLWVATRTGLFRFDGENFQPCPQVSAAALPGLMVPVMLRDRRNRLWLAKDRGAMACVDGAATRVFTIRDGLPDLQPVSMAEDGEGAIWISYAAGPLYQIKDARVQPCEATAGMSGQEASWLIADRQGQIWFARGGGVGVLRAGRFATLLTLEQPALRLAAARGGGVWLSDGQKVWKFKEGGKLELLGRIPAGQVKLLREDQPGRLWAAVALEGPLGGLFCHEGGDFKRVPISCTAVVSLSDDREGNLWVGTLGAGLLQVRPRAVELVNPEADVPLVAVQSFCEDNNGMRFAVGQNGLLARWQNSAWETMTVFLQGVPTPVVRWQRPGWERMTAPLGWPGGPATCVAADPRGGVWLGTTERGLFQWRDGKFFSLGDTNVLARHAIHALFPGATGDLWIGQEQAGTLHRLRDGHLLTLKLPSNTGQVSALAEDASNTLWVATTDGRLARVNGETVEDVTSQTLSAPAPIRCLHAAPDGSLWIGYAARGLGWLKHGRFFLFGLEQGLWDAGISQILSDRRAWLWCAGDRGVFRIPLADLEAVAAGQLPAIRMVLCGRGEGLPNLQAGCGVWPGPVYGHAGELWMPMLAGLAVIHPERSLEYPPPPAVVIERLLVNGRPVAAYDSQESWDRSNAVALVDLHGLTNRLALGPGVRQWAAEFTVPSFTGQENIRFRYQLEGLDETWVDVGSRRVAYFSMVPPGQYQFRMMACNNEGVWNDVGAVLAFTVLPYYWQTWWFRVLSWIAGGGVAGTMVWMETRRRLRRKLERVERQRALERERARIARDIHDDLGASLTRIGMLSQPGGAAPETPERTAANLNVIYQTAHGLTQTLDEIVWAVSPQHDTLDSLATYLGKFAQDFLRHTGMRCRLDMPLQLPPLTLTAEKRHHLFLACKEALNNAAKYSQATEVRITLTLTAGGFAIQLEDNGVGLPPAATPGAPVPDDPAQRTGGRGLTNMRRRLEEIGGRCEIRSTPGVGTSILFTVPALQAGTPAHHAGPVRLPWTRDGNG